MRNWIAAAVVATLGAGAAQAGEIGDQLAQKLYDGTLRDLAAPLVTACDAGEGDACFALGLLEITGAYETFAQALYRHGAVAPNSSAFGLILGMSADAPPTPANPDPEPLTYDGFREILEEFVASLDQAADHMKRAGEGTPFVVAIDPLRVRMDLDGDGEAAEGETLGMLLNEAGGFLEIPMPGLPPSGKTKTKSPDAAPDTTIGFDNADAIWFAGYANVTATPFDIALAHDFSQLFDAYFHRVFPEAGLPMQAYSHGHSTVMMDADGDTAIADLIAAIHTANFPVIDSQRLAGVLTRLGTITALSRQNWQMILAETDDFRELVPSPSQTSLIPGQEVTQEIVDAWLDTLDTLDEIIAGDLLLPHWRFSQGFSLKTFFETSTETDVVMLFAGQGALPYLQDGPVADAASFAELNRVMGDDWPMFAAWFN